MIRSPPQHTHTPKNNLTTKQTKTFRGSGHLTWSSKNLILPKILTVAISFVIRFMTLDNEANLSCNLSIGIQYIPCFCGQVLNLRRFGDSEMVSVLALTLMQ